MCRCRVGRRQPPGEWVVARVDLRCVGPREEPRSPATRLPRKGVRTSRQRGPSRSSCRKHPVAEACRPGKDRPQHLEKPTFSTFRRSRHSAPTDTGRLRNAAVQRTGGCVARHVPHAVQAAGGAACTGDHSLSVRGRAAGTRCRASPCGAGNDRCAASQAPPAEPSEPSVGRERRKPGTAGIRAPPPRGQDSWSRQTGGCSRRSGSRRSRMKSSRCASGGGSSCRPS